jgi:protein gp37
MADNSKIEWTDSTWNPVTGCRKVSAGCQNCYAERMALRLQAMGRSKYAKGFDIAIHPDCLVQPKHWRSPRFVFVNSMSDLFLPDIPAGFVERVFEVMNECPSHTFQVLTKRPEVALQLSGRFHWTPNIWLGVTVEDNSVVQRVECLGSIPAAVRFASLEPLLSSLPDVSLGLLDWVIVGGESGPGARPMQVAWARDIRDRCLAANVPFFFKQWGGANKKRAGRELDGRKWSQMPAAYCTI